VSSPPLDIAVVIPVWNRKEIFPATFETLVAQEAPPRTVVVVDDGSTDGTADAVEAWLAAEERPFSWEVIRSGHAGCAPARNRGRRACAPHRYLHFLDSDDLLPPDFYARTVAALEANPGAIAASTDQEFERPWGEVVRPFRIARLAQNPPRWLLMYGAGVLSLTLLRTELVPEGACFPEHLLHGDDLFFLFEISAHGTWLHVEGAPVRYRQHADGGNLSTPTPEVWRRWAQNRENLLAMAESRKRVGWSLRTHVLSRHWLMAGQAAHDAGLRRDAIACALRSMRYRPLRPRAYKQLLLALATRRRPSDLYRVPL
jgi:glycosyltransferase involved in cell wall biosynthesis